MKIPSLQNINSCNKNYEFLCKWGCEVSNGQAQYRIKFDLPTSQSQIDSDLFMFSFVPLLMYCMNGDEKAIIWQNLRPSSTRFCRPIKYMLQKETAESTRN